MSTIDEVKERLDIVDVVSSYVPNLKKSGRNFKALCPFHNEKTPSFYVFPERQSWHCFGSCAVGGDVFSFVMKKENIEFGEALRLLAEKAGVTLAPKPEAERSHKEVDIVEAAVQYYHNLLLNSSAAKGARQYLESRGISAQSIADFQLGYSLEAWDASKQYLTEKGWSEKDLLEAGMLVLREGGGSYDRFRNRLMFPIRDTQGRSIGFGARALDDSIPKYLNSAQTAIFDKSGTLYGLDRAKAHIRQKDLAVVVEGYFDVIVAHQYGFGNVVASMGTALAEKQVKLLKRLTKNITLALDADAAGQEATLRGVEAAKQGLDQKTVPVPTSRGLIGYENMVDGEVKVMVLPEGKDPDEVVRAEPQRWTDLSTNAQPVIQYVFAMMASKLDLSKVTDRRTAVAQLLPLVAEVREPVRRADYLQRLARLVKVDENTLAIELKRLESPRSKKGDGAVQPGSSSPPQTSRLEEYCLALLLQHPELRPSSNDLKADYFCATENREIFLVWQAAEDMESLRNKLPEALQPGLERLLASALPSATGPELERSLAQCQARLKQRWLRDMKEIEEFRLRETAEQGDRDEMERLQQQGLELNVGLKQSFARQARRDEP